jgi:hypothetical protein
MDGLIWYFLNSITIYKSGSSQLARVKEKKGKAKAKAKAKKLEKEKKNRLLNKKAKASTA